MDLEISNIHECCRICLQGSKEEEVFEIDEQVIYQFLQITQTKLEQSEQLPNIICNLCVDELQKSYDFRAKIIKYQEQLSNFIEGNCGEEPDLNVRNLEILDEFEDENNDSNEADDDTSIDQFLAYQDSLLETPKPKKIKNVLDIEELHIFAERPKKTLETDDCDDCCLQISPKETFTCDEPNCKYLFKNEENLKIHKIIYHMDLVNDRNECIYCNKSFKEKRLLKRHLISHLNITRFDCKFCDRKFKLKHHLKNHIEHVHAQSKDYLCSICGKSFTSKRSLNDHLDKIHCDAEKLNCGICDKNFITRKALCDHQEIHDEAVEPNLLCNVCGLKFQKRSKFALHLKNKCSKNEKISICSTPSECSIGTVTSTTSKANCQYFCKVCNILLDGKIELDQHNKITHTNIFNCTFCPKQFYVQKTFENHLLTHDPNTVDDRKHVCSICDFKFKRADHLNIHFLRKHTKERGFKCTECTSCFPTNFELKIHQRKHSGNRPFQCNRCDKRYMQSYQLVVHQNSTHFNERNYHCTICLKKFCTAAILNNHLNIHNIAIGGN